MNKLKQLFLHQANEFYKGYYPNWVDKISPHVLDNQDLFIQSVTLPIIKGMPVEILMQHDGKWFVSIWVKWVDRMCTLQRIWGGAFPIGLLSRYTDDFIEPLDVRSESDYLSACSAISLPYILIKQALVTGQAVLQRAKQKGLLSQSAPIRLDVGLPDLPREQTILEVHSTCANEFAQHLIEKIVILAERHNKIDKTYLKLNNKPVCIQANPRSITVSFRSEALSEVIRDLLIIILDRNIWDMHQRSPMGFCW